ncbi:MAG: hypothetical protein ACC642_10215 [Pseudomonadales bacterium]
MTTAEILAAARAGSSKSQAPTTEPEPARAEAERLPAQAGKGADVPESPTQSAVPSGPVDKSSMTPEEICAWCRAHDGA